MGFLDRIFNRKSKEEPKAQTPLSPQWPIDVNAIDFSQVTQVDPTLDVTPTIQNESLPGLNDLPVIEIPQVEAPEDNFTIDVPETLNEVANDLEVNEQPQDALVGWGSVLNSDGLFGLQPEEPKTPQEQRVLQLVEDLKKGEFKWNITEVTENNLDVPYRELEEVNDKVLQEVWGFAKKTYRNVTHWQEEERDLFWDYFGVGPKVRWAPWLNLRIDRWDIDEINARIFEEAATENWLIDFEKANQIIEEELPDWVDRKIDVNGFIEFQNRYDEFTQRKQNDLEEWDSYSAHREKVEAFNRQLLRNNTWYNVIDDKVDNYLNNTDIVNPTSSLYDGMNDSRRAESAAQTRILLDNTLNPDRTLYKEVLQKKLRLINQWGDADAIARLDGILENIASNTDNRAQNIIDLIEIRIGYERQGYSVAEAEALTEDYLLDTYGMDIPAFANRWVSIGDYQLWQTGLSALESNALSAQKQLSINADLIYNSNTNSRNWADKKLMHVFDYLQKGFNIGWEWVAGTLYLIHEGIDSSISAMDWMADWEISSPGSTRWFKRIDATGASNISFTNRKVGKGQKLLNNIQWLDAEFLSFFMMGGTWLVKATLSSWRVLGKWAQITPQIVNGLNKIWVNPKVVNSLAKFSDNFAKYEWQVVNIMKKIWAETLLEAKFQSFETNTGSDLQRKSLFLLAYPMAVMGDVVRLSKTIAPKVFKGKLFNNAWSDALEAIDKPLIEKFWTQGWMSPEQVKQVAGVMKNNMKAYSDFYGRVMNLDETIPGVREMKAKINQQAKAEYIRWEAMWLAQKAQGWAIDQADQIKLLQMFKEYQDPRYSLFDMFKLNTWIEWRVGYWAVGSNVTSAQKVANSTLWQTPWGIQRIIDNNFDYEFSTLVRDVMNVDNKVFNPNNVYSAAELEVVSRNISNQWVYKDLLDRTSDGYKYFRKSWDGFVLNKEWMERLDIRNRSRGQQRFVDELLDWWDMVEAARVSWVMDDATLRQVSSSGAFDKVTEYFRKIIGC